MDAARPVVTADAAADDPSPTQEALLARVGQMTRSLHDSLRGLDFDKLAANAPRMTSPMRATGSTTLPG